MSLRARLLRVERNIPEPPCDVCGEPSGKVRMRMTLGTEPVEDYDPNAPENQHEDAEHEDTTPVPQSDRVRESPEDPLIERLRTEEPEATTLHCPKCMRIIYRRLSLHTPRLGEREYQEGE